MDEIVKGVVETTSVPDNVEQLVKVNIKDGKASAILFANPNGSKIKQRLDNLEARFNNLKTINYEELYGPGNIDIKQGGSSGDVTKSYVDTQDNATYEKSKSYTDSKITDLRSYVDNASNTTLEQAKSYADSISQGGSSGDKSTVVLIDAIGRTSQARSEAYTAYKAGKAIVLKCAANKFIPMTVVAESSNTVDLKGFDLSYSGYAVTPNVTLVTRMWTLDSTGLNYVEKSVPINSCRTFDCTNSSIIANTFANALDSYNNGFSIILKVDTNTFVVANTVTTSSLTGYSFQFNAGTTSEGQTGIVSVDITRWRLTSAGLSKDTFSTESSGSGGGGSVTLRQAFSTKTTSLAIPNNPDDDPTFWNQSSQTSASIWAAQKSTGNDWVVWKLQPQDGTDGNGISDIKKNYAVSDSGTKTPASSEFDKNTNIPEAKPGQYIWCRITIKYTGSTVDTVYYTVSYIGKDGQDGAKGTPINIKGSLSSKENLPSSGNTNGDGYIIGKDLWVYDGNSITSEITYGGFTNVGQIVGPDGKTSCFHRAWCNGDPASGDYTGFDTDAPDGSLFDYMGTYVDYVSSVEEAKSHPDSTDPTDYKWTRIRGVDGENAVTLDFDNDSDSIGLTYEGKVEYNQTISTNIGMFEGQEVMSIQNIKCDAPNGMAIQTATSGSGSEKYPGKITISVNEGDTYIKSGSNNITVTVTAKCISTGKTHIASRVFHITGRKAGSPGESSVLYRLVLSNSEIRKYSDGSYSVNFVSVIKKQKKVGKADWVDTTDGEIKYSIDESVDRTPCELNYGISVTSVNRCVDFYLYVNGVLEDGPEHIPLNANGTIGESAKVISETYRYAVAMSFTKTPSDLTNWSTEPINVEPGQYLYIETKREWNNGDTTYSYSWTRGGLNGYSNLPFVSTVFMRSSTQPNTPSGGNYNNPLPETDGWSDGVPEGTEKLWYSQRKFTIDGLEPQDTLWSTPETALSSSTRNIRYSSANECPKTPDVESSSVWSSVPDLNSKWGAYQSIVNNVKQPWVLLQIKGEGSRIDTTSAATPFMGEWNASTKYYGTKLRTDIVRVSGTSGADDPATYYYIANKAKNFDGVVTPQPGTTEGDKYWLRFGANYDNLATGFLFSEKIETDILNAVNAHIDELDVDSLDVKIVNAINNGEGVINADKINVGDLTAKVLKTADEGAMIYAEGTRLSAFNENNSIIFDADPTSGIRDVAIDSDIVYEKNSTIFTRTYTGTSAESQTSTNTFGSISIPASKYNTVLTADDLRIGIRATNTTTSSTVLNKTNVELYYIISGTDYMFARCGLSSSVNDGSIHICSIQYFNIVRYFSTTTGVGIKAKVTHSAEDNDQSSLTYGTTITVSILNGSKFVARRDYGSVICDGAFSVGQINEYNHAVLGSAFDGGKAAIDVASNGTRMVVSDDVYLKHKGLGLLPSLNPVTIDISSNPVYNSEREISERDMCVIYTCFNSGIPVYIKTVVKVPDVAQLVSISARVNAVKTESYTTTATYVSILATADLHRMNSGNWTDSTDYRVNIFAERNLSNTLTYDTASTSLSSSYTIKTYIHTV